jgi:hypothetical protein
VELDGNLSGHKSNIIPHVLLLNSNIHWLFHHVHPYFQAFRVAKLSIVAWAVSLPSEPPQT